MSMVQHGGNGAALPAAHLNVSSMVERAFACCNEDADRRDGIINSAKAAIVAGRGHRWNAQITNADGAVWSFTLDHHHARPNVWHLELASEHADPEESATRFIWIGPPLRLS